MLDKLLLQLCDSYSFSFHARSDLQSEGQRRRRAQVSSLIASPAVVKPRSSHGRAIVNHRDSITILGHVGSYTKELLGFTDQIFKMGIT